MRRTCSLPALLQVGALFFLLLAATSAERAHAEEGGVVGPPMTALAAGSLARSRVIILGRVQRTSSVREGRGVQIATIEVERVLKGSTPRKSLTVIVGGPRPTNDPHAPSVPYLEPDPKTLLALFLGRRDRGESLNLITAFPVGGLLGAEKIEVLQHHIDLAAIREEDARARATLAFLLEAQKAEGTWTRVHAARELNYLMRVRGDLFDAAVKAQVEALAAKAHLPAQRTWLARVLRTLHCVPPPTAPRRDGASPDLARLREQLAAADDEAARLKVLRTVLEQGGARGLHGVFLVLPEVEPTVRRHLIELLAEGGWRDALPAIRGLYAHETEPAVQKAIVAAVGRLGGGGEVGWLERRTRSLRVRREALHALARVGTPEARQALERFRAKAEAVGEGDTDVTALVDYLLGSAFPKEGADDEGRGPPR